MQKRSPISAIVTAVVFLMLEAAAIAVLHYNNELQRSWISGAGHSAMAVLWGGGEQVRNYFGLSARNDSLAAENARLFQRVHVLEDRLEAAERLTGEKEFHGAGEKYRFTSATIIKLSDNRQHNYLILDKGASDGVMVGDGIITAKGVVGIVENVSEHYCYGISFRNYNMNVSARLGKEGPVGPLKWNGYRNATLEEIPHHLVTELGDTVYTSGFSAIFPKDIPVGVTVDSRLKDGATYNLEVKLFENFSSLKYVTIVSLMDDGEIEKLEKEGM